MADNGLDRERLTWMLTQMVRIREFEERVKRTFEDHPGVIRGHTHLADGAEASIVGSIAALRPDDQLLTTYRCHGYPLVLGTDSKGNQVAIGWGLFINALIVFVVVMLVVYLISKLFIREADPPGPSAEEVLLTEIRDELRSRPASAAAGSGAGPGA